MSTISIIAAIADKSAIGKNQQLLCQVTLGMKRFKELTTCYLRHSSLSL